MRTDDHVHESHLHFAEDDFPFGGGGGSDQQLDVETRDFQERLEVLVVLPCENVRGHHQRALLAHPVAGAVTAAYRHHRKHRDHGLAAADVALQQRVELLFAVEPRDNLVECR